LTADDRLSWPLAVGIPSFWLAIQGKVFEAITVGDRQVAEIASGKQLIA
jgi:hypothetical protein